MRPSHQRSAGTWFDSHANVKCRQLKAAQKETEKLQAAGDAYKRELLQQKLSDTEWALSREQDRAKDAEADSAGGPLPASPEQQCNAATGATSAL
jgi:hypothetical protein